ncbi:MAG TPA: GNAT family protein [Planktothrix sp.]
MVQIETNRLILREYTDEDFAQVHAYCADPMVTRFMTWGPNSEKQTQEFLTSVQWLAVNEDPRKVYEMAVVLKETQTIVGGIGMRLKSERKKDADIGYCFSQSVWGRGVGTEAAEAMLKLGFTKLGLHRIWATCALENKGSEGIMRKIGMRKEAHYRLEDFIMGDWQDSVLYAILADEWQQRSNRAECAISLLA